VTRLPWTLLPAVLLAGLALAQQQAPPADEPQTDQAATAEDDVPFLDELPAEAPKEPVPAAAPAEGQAEPQQAEEQEEKLPPLPPGQRSTGPTPQRFDPSEEVRADFPVSFPIDI
jgi:hypothetical protein